jgi:DNA-binding transcriptional regulator GbsR (MarR family)
VEEAEENKTMNIIKVPMHEIGLSQEEINKQTEKFEKAGMKVVDVIKAEDVKEAISNFLRDLKDTEDNFDDFYMSTDIGQIFCTDKFFKFLDEAVIKHLGKEFTFPEPLASKDAQGLGEEFK